ELGYSRASELVVAIPGKHVLLKWVSVPTSDPNRIAEMAPYEVRALAPWPEGEYVYGYELIERRDDGSASLLMALVKRELIDGLLETLRTAGLEASRIEIDALALLQILSKRDGE